MAVLALIAAVLAAGERHAAAGLLDFVSFDGIDYVRWIEETGRELTPRDLGLEFATVECSVGEDVRGCPYGTDAGAAFLPAGTRVYAVHGYRTEFRLAAVWKDRVFLYQAWRNPRARVGADLYDIAGKVRAIDVERDEPTPARVSRRLPIRSREDVDRLIALLLESPVHPPQAHPAGEPRLWLTFWLSDGTTLGRTYFPETSEVMGGIAVPPAFRRIVERAFVD